MVSAQLLLLATTLFSAAVSIGTSVYAYKQLIEDAHRKKYTEKITQELVAGPTCLRGRAHAHEQTGCFTLQTKEEQILVHAHNFRYVTWEVQEDQGIQAIDQLVRSNKNIIVRGEVHIHDDETSIEAREIIDERGLLKPINVVNLLLLPLFFALFTAILTQQLL